MVALALAGRMSLEAVVLHLYKRGSSGRRKGKKIGVTEVRRTIDFDKAG